MFFIRQRSPGPIYVSGCHSLSELRCVNLTDVTLTDEDKTKIDFSPQKHKVLPGQSNLEQKIKFCLKWSKRVQISPKMSQMVKNVLY